MSYQGPSRSFASPEWAALEERRRFDESELSSAMARADQASRTGRDFAANIERVNAEQTAREAGRARLAMTPGVRQGGSTATRSVADSPLMQGSSTRFEQFGQTYSYDPMVAGEQEGAASGIATATAERQRYEAAQRIPGIKQRDAARLVYGAVAPASDDPKHQALARYLGDRTTENAQAAIRAGASGADFNFPEFDRFGRERVPGHPPTPGSPEYFAMRQEEENIRVKGTEEEIRVRAQASASRDPGAANRREAQQTRLALDEGRRDLPRPSKVPARIVQLDAKGQAQMVDNPARAQATADSTAYERNTMDPLRAKFRSLVTDEDNPLMAPAAGAAGAAGAVGRSSGASVNIPASRSFRMGEANQPAAVVPPNPVGRKPEPAAGAPDPAALEAAFQSLKRRGVAPTSTALRAELERLKATSQRGAPGGD